MLPINILTVSCGRTLYLERLLESIAKFGGDLQDIHHYIYLQGTHFEGTPQEDLTKKTEWIRNLFDGMPSLYRGNAFLTVQNGTSSIGEVLNAILPAMPNNGYFLKLDDDAVIRSPDFFDHAREIIKLTGGNSIISPFPVGLINNLGGVPAQSRRVIYSETLNHFYTLRVVNHVGGFARLCPLSFIKQVKFSAGHSEDGEFSSWCSQNNTPMFYLENALIIEHQESTLGQHERYRANYFGERF